MKKDSGHTIVLALLSVVVIVIISSVGWLVYRNDHKPTKVATSSSQNTPTTTNVVDPYAGWKTYCDRTNEHGCFHYPPNWVTAQYTGLENPSMTAYVDYQGYNNKDQDTGEAYIVSIDAFKNVNLHLTIIGSVSDNLPSYAVYNTADVANLNVGENTKIAVVNPEFSVNNTSMSFVATPGMLGSKNITNEQQAKAWFNTPEAATNLKILQSLSF